MAGITPIDGSYFSSTSIVSQPTGTTNISDVKFESILDGTEDTTYDISSNPYENIFVKAANTYGIDVDLLKAVAYAESNFKNNVTSSAGAMGIMQLMPATAKYLGVENPFDPEQNIMGGAKLLSENLQKYNGNISLALAAYNCGSNAVDKYNGIPPYGETQAYVKKIMQYYNKGIAIPDAAIDEKAIAASQKAAAAKTTINDPLRDIPTYDVYLTSTEETDYVAGVTVDTATATTTTAAPVDTTTANAKSSDYSYSDYLDFVDDYMNIITGNKKESNEQDSLANMLNNYYDANNTAYSSSLLKLLQSRLRDSNKQS